MKTVIGISGKSQHGKDTIADYLISRYGGTKVAFADLVKEQAKYIGWDGEKDTGGRTLLQKISEPIKEYGNWLAKKYPERCSDFGGDSYYAASLYNKIKSSNENLFFVSDLRFDKEYSLFSNKKDIHFIKIRVYRTNNGHLFDNGMTIEQMLHESEMALDDKTFDYYFDNDGSLEDLYKKLDDSSLKEVLERA